MHSRWAGKHWIVGLVCLFFCCTVFATEKDDTQKPISVKSDAFQYEHTKGIATYRGQVIAKQGSRELRAERLEIFHNPSGEIEKIIAHGSPAEQEVQSEPNKPSLHAQAKTITYDPLHNKMILEEGAQIDQAGNVYQAPYIEYDILERVVRSPDSAQGRTTITLQPRE